MPRLPDANDGSVALNLVDVAALDPYVLHRRDRRNHGWSRRNDGRRRHDGGRGHDGGRCHDNRRRSHRIVDRATYHAADEARPEVTSAATPETVVVMVVKRRRPESRAVMPPAARRPEVVAGAAMESAARTAMRSG